MPHSLVPLFSWRVHALLLVPLGLAECDVVVITSSKSIAEDVIRLEEKALIKIINAREVSLSPRDVTCQVVAVYRDGTEIRMRYRAYIDEDRDLMIAYDADEAQQEASDREEAEAEAAGRKAAEEIEREMDQTMREAVGSDRWEAAKRDADGYDF